jgi:hypothetical protein
VPRRVYALFLSFYHVDFPPALSSKPELSQVADDYICPV